MNIQRAKELSVSAEQANVSFQGMPVMIQHVDESNETARPKYIPFCASQITSYSISQSFRFKSASRLCQRFNQRFSEIIRFARFSGYATTLSFNSFTFSSPYKLTPSCTDDTIHCFHNLYHIDPPHPKSLSLLFLLKVTNL